MIHQGRVAGVVYTRAGYGTRWCTLGRVRYQVVYTGQGSTLSSWLPCPYYSSLPVYQCYECSAVCRTGEHRAQGRREAWVVTFFLLPCPELSLFCGKDSLVTTRA